MIANSSIIDSERLSERDNYNLKLRYYFVVNVCDSPLCNGKYVETVANRVLKNHFLLLGLAY